MRKVQRLLPCIAELPFKELSRQYTPCAWALVPDSPEVLMIEDLAQDARHDHPQSLQ